MTAGRLPVGAVRSVKATGCSFTRVGRRARASLARAFRLLEGNTSPGPVDRLGGAPGAAGRDDHGVAAVYPPQQGQAEQDPAQGLAPAAGRAGMAAEQRVTRYGDHSGPSPGPLTPPSQGGPVTLRRSVYRGKARPGSRLAAHPLAPSRAHPRPLGRGSLRPGRVPRSSVKARLTLGACQGRLDSGGADQRPPEAEGPP